jgi:hypothetical protein
LTKPTENQCIEIFPKLSDGTDGRWRWGKDTAHLRINELVALPVKGRDEFDIFQKDYLTSNILDDENDDLKRIKPKSFWFGSEFSSDAGTKSLKEVLPNSDFKNPKSTALIQYCITQATNSDTPSVILDFFAGSGTTAQAVMELNKEDGGNRQCILVTNNENEICTKVCYPRVQRVIGGYPFSGNKETVLFEKNITWTDFKKNIKVLERVKEIEQVNRVYPEYDEVKKEIKDGKLKVVGVKKIEDKTEGLGNSLKYYRTDFVGKHHAKEATDSDKTELAHKAGYLLAIAENTLEEVEATDYYQFFTNNTEGSFTAVYFRDFLGKYYDTFREKVEALNKPVSIYIFDWANAESFEEDFKHLHQAELKALPNAIVGIYKAIFQQAPLIPETETEQE